MNNGMLKISLNDKHYPSLSLYRILSFQTMKNVVLTLLLSISLLLFSNHSMAGSGEDVIPPKTAKDYHFDFIFPVNVFSSKVNLNVDIPKNFKPIEQPPNSGLLEFMPQSDIDPYQWSEIITLIPLIGKSINAKDYIAGLTGRFQDNDPNLTIVETHDQKYPDYQESYTIIKYRTSKFIKTGRDEIVMLYAASGPYDAVCVQYALALKPNEDIAGAVQKLKQFMTNNVKIVQ